MTHVGPIPNSLPRDELLYHLKRGNLPLWSAVTSTTTRYAPRRKRVVVTFEFDPFEYLRLTERR